MDDYYAKKSQQAISSAIGMMIGATSKPKSESEKAEDRAKDASDYYKAQVKEIEKSRNSDD